MMNRNQLPESMLQMRQLPLSPAFEMRNGRLTVKFERDVPSVRVRGTTYLVTDGQAVVVGGRKLAVDALI